MKKFNYYFGYNGMTDRGHKALIKFLRDLFKGDLHEESRSIINEISNVNKIRADLYKTHIKPLNEEVQDLNGKLKNLCSHPNMEVKEESHSDSDDWAQTTWYWETYDVKCSDCNFRQIFKAADGKWFKDEYGEWKENIDVPNFLKELKQKDQKTKERENRDLAKQAKIDAEIKEKQEYERLRAKFESHNTRNTT